MLKEILKQKRSELEAAQDRVTISQLIDAAALAPKPQGFLNRLRESYEACSRTAPRKPALIAELKKASPSKGLIRSDFNPESIAQAYARGGASALSVLTDERFFAGRAEYLTRVRHTCSLPVLRKDFIIDEYQVYEARAIGADALLLIVAALDHDRLESLLGLTHELGMDALVEVHTAPELERAVAAGADLIGINNRSLSTFRTNLETTRSLAPSVPGDRFLVSESGIRSPDDIAMLAGCGVKAVLVGEALMRQPDVEEATRLLLGLGA